jgi:hypothetical protein
MRRTILQSGCILLTAIVLLGCGHGLAAPTGEENLLVLRNGGMVCGILQQIGGRIVVYRKETGDNFLDARPAQWKDSPQSDLLGRYFKQYYGESVWAGPQDAWWTGQEPYPPPHYDRWGGWPPDPAWELAAFTVEELTPTRIVLRSRVSKLTGLELTKTIELQSDGQLKIHEKAVNRGDKIVTRDLWLLHRVDPGSTCFLPLISENARDEFMAAVDVQKAGDLTVLQLRSGVPFWGRGRGGKMEAVAQAGWMATTVPGGFFVVRFQATDAAKVVPGHSPVEITFSSEPDPLCELEHHGELKTLNPGDAMESEETWQIVPYTGMADINAQAKFLQTEESSQEVPASVPATEK